MGAKDVDAEAVFVKVGRARDSSGDGEHWKREAVAPTINLFDLSSSRACVLTVRFLPNHNRRS